MYGLTHNRTDLSARRKNKQTRQKIDYKLCCAAMATNLSTIQCNIDAISFIVVGHVCSQWQMYAFLYLKFTTAASILFGCQTISAKFSQ